MYIRVANPPIFPYDLDQLKLEYPNVSFPVQFTEQLLSGYGIFKVQYEEAPSIDERTQYTSYDQEPTYVNELGAWVVKCNVIEKDQATIDAYDAYISNMAKIKRDKLLNESDWITIKAVERGEAVPNDWKTYRQELRDITAQTGFPHNIVWPIQPGVN